jgi:hypothetical protein
MGDGGWEMGDGRWEMEDGRWKMEDGRWEMGDGGWKLEVGITEINLRTLVPQNLSPLNHINKTLL